MVLAVASPIDAVGESDLFFLHMTQHLLLGDIAPLCLLAGLTGPLLRPCSRFPPSCELRVLANPVVALPDLDREPRSLAPAAPLRRRARVEHRVHSFEHIAFFTAGIVLWLPVLETLPAPEWFGTGAKLAYIVGVRLVATVLGNVFIWAASPSTTSTTRATTISGIAARRPEPCRLADDARGIS